MKEISKKTSTFLFILLIGVLVVIAFISYNKISEFNKSADWVMHTHVVKENIVELRNNLKDAETGHHGYLLTYNSIFLEPFNGLHQRNNLILATLDSLVSDNATQEVHLKKLKILIDNQYLFLNNSLNLLKTKHQTSSADSLLTLGKLKMDEVQKQIMFMLQIEDELLLQRTQFKDRSATGVPITLLLLSLFSIIALTLFFFRLQKETNVRVSTVKLAQLQTEARKQIEAMQQSTNNERTVFYNLLMDAPAGIFILQGPTFVVEFVNPTYEKISGKKLILGKTVKELFPEIVQQGYIEMLNNVFSTGKPYIANEQSIDLDTKGNGILETFYRNFVVQPLNDENGKVERLFVHIMDITEQKSQKEKLSDVVNQLRLYEKVVLNINEAVMITEAESFELPGPKILYVNEAFCNMTGYTADEVIGKTPRILQGPKTNRKELDRLKKALSKWEFVQVELINYRKDGTEFVVEFDIVPVADEHGKFTHMVSVQRDITEQNKAKENLQRSELFNRTILESSPDCLKVLDTEGRIQYMNFNGICQMELDDFSTVKNKNWWTLWNSENQALVKASFDKALKGETAHFTALRLTAKGSPKWWNVVVSPVSNPDGTVQQIISVSRDITEQKVAEEKIRQSEEMFKSVFDNSLAAILVADDKGNYISANKATSKLLGYSIDELMQMNVGDLKTTAQPGAAKRYEEYIRKGEESGEFDFITKNGEHKFAQYQATRIKADFHLSILMDITQQKETEEQIRKSKERLQGGLDVANVALAEFDYHTGLVMLSVEAALMYGLSPNHLIVTRKQIHNTFHPDGRDTLELLIENCLNPKGDGLIATEHRILLPDGKTRWLKVNKQVYFDEHRTKPLYSILAAQDITVRKEAKEKIQASEEQFRTFADSIQNLAWIANADGWIYWYNQRWYDYTGTTLEEMQGWGWQKVHHPDHVEKIIERSKELWKKDEAFELTFPLRRHDGEYHWFLTRAYPIKDANNNIEKWIGTNTDITEQKSFAEELEKKVKERTKELQTANLSLESTNAELNAFSYIASHDLQEPLRKIQTFAKRIVETENFSNQTQDYFNRIITAGERMQNLIVSLLDFSRTNTTELIFKTCDLNKIVEESKSDLDQKILEKQAIIEHEILPVINGIDVQMAQLFTNLIDNAIKYSRPEIKPQIKITASIVEGKEMKHPTANNQKEYHAIKIADNGIGFKKEYETKIFEIFQRLHHKNEYSGTGIGLAIVKKIVTNHNGFIVAESIYGQGSTFTIYLPKA